MNMDATDCPYCYRTPDCPHTRCDGCGFIVGPNLTHRYGPGDYCPDCIDSARNGVGA